MPRVLQRAAVGGKCVCESWNSERSLFNYFLSFCPIGLHREPFNYTIHHLLNMKNGVKHMLIKACPKAHQMKQMRHGWKIYVRMNVAIPFILLNPRQHVDGSSMSLESGGGMHLKAFAGCSLCAFHFCPVNELKVMWRTRLNSPLTSELITETVSSVTGHINLFTLLFSNLRNLCVLGHFFTLTPLFVLFSPQ